MQSDGAERRLAAVLAADVVGYSRLMQADDRATLEALTERRRLFAERAAAHGGRVVNAPGDSILVEFSSVVAAVQCAVELQRKLAALDEGVAEARRMRFRMGIHLGDVLVDGAGIYGDGVNIAARLESACDPGSVALSAAAYEQVRDKLPLRFVDRGEQQVKNIARPVRIYGIELSGEKPAARLRFSGARRSVVALLLAAAALAGGWWAAQWARQPAEAAPATIAVLPFANQSGDPQRAYFTDGVTQDIISALGRFSELRVMSHSAVQPYKAAPTPPEQIGRELGVRYLVRGSVREAEGRVRVGVELSEAASGRLLWSERYDAAGKELFDIQDRIVRNVAGALAVRLASLEQQRAAAMRPESMEAYDLVLRARELLSRYERTPNREARELLGRALRLEPRYAEVHAWLAQGELQRVAYGWTEHPEESLRRAEEHARAALANDRSGGNARAHAVLGALYSFIGNYQAALAETDRALQLNPSDAFMHTQRGGVLLWLGRLEESIRASETARRYEPRLTNFRAFNLAMAHFLAGRPAEAVLVCETYTGAVNADLQAVRAAALAELGQTEPARLAAAEAKRLNPFFDASSFGERFVDPALAEKARAGVRKAGL
ncbi:MAG TPA: adenylate/guanylate cyclase domain-containing protein [Burkholderiales bacterium]|nr:adenylate/guanylate cyclase domain-containing protein [Burkholderiales bacterium]